MLAPLEISRNAQPGKVKAARMRMGKERNQRGQGQYKGRNTPKDAQPYRVCLSSASPISVSTATRLCVGTVAPPVRTTALSVRTDAPPTTLLR